MNSDFDLDKIAPEPVKIKLSGQILELYPAKLKLLLRIERAFNNLQTKQGTVQDVVDVLAEIVPRLKDDDIDISISQLQKLIEIAYQISTPKQDTEIKKANMQPSQKKMTPVSSGQSPTSSDVSQDTN